MSTLWHGYVRRWIGSAITDVLRSGQWRRNRRLAHLRLQSGSQLSISEIDLRMMQRAIELARNAAAVGEVPVGAVVYCNDEILAEAYNLRETDNDPTGHAELLAISQAGKIRGEWRLTDCSLAVTLEPCPMCAGAMVNARLGRVVYGATDPKAGACHTLYRIPVDSRLNHRVEMIGGVMADECAKLLTDFFQNRRRANKQVREARSD